MVIRRPDRRCGRKIGDLKKGTVLTSTTEANKSRATRVAVAVAVAVVEILTCLTVSRNSAGELYEITDGEYAKADPLYCLGNAIVYLMDSLVLGLCQKARQQIRNAV